MEKLDELAFKDSKPVFNDLEKMAGIRFMTWEEEVAYQRALKRMWDYDAVMDGERRYAREQGHKEGMQEGKLEGKQETAANLKKLGVPLETIMQASGLTKEQIEAL